MTIPLFSGASSRDRMLVGNSSTVMAPGFRHSFRLSDGSPELFTRAAPGFKLKGSAQ